MINMLICILLHFGISVAPLKSDEHLICLLNGDNSPFLKEVLSTLVSEGLDKLRLGVRGVQCLPVN